MPTRKTQKKKKKRNLSLAEPEADNRLLPRVPRAARVPAHVAHRLVQHVLVLPVDADALVPPPVAAADELVHAVLPRVRVVAAEAAQQARHRGVAGHVAGPVGELRLRGQLPGRRLAVEDVHLCRLAGEEVVVARLAAASARRVGHVRGRHLVVFARVGVPVGGCAWRYCYSWGGGGCCCCCWAWLEAVGVDAWLAGGEDSSS